MSGGVLPRPRRDDDDRSAPQYLLCRATRIQPLAQARATCAMSPAPELLRPVYPGATILAEIGQVDVARASAATPIGVCSWRNHRRQLSRALANGIRLLSPLTARFGVSGAANRSVQRCEVDRDRVAVGEEGISRLNERQVRAAVSRSRMLLPRRFIDP